MSGGEKGRSPAGTGGSGEPDGRGGPHGRSERAGELEPIGKDTVVVDAGGTKTRLGALRAGTPLDVFATFDSRRFEIAPAHEVLGEAVRGFAEAHGLDLGSLVVGIPGMLDESRERISHCNNVPAFEGETLRGGLAAALGVPVLFEQDIMLQLLGEWRVGVARGHGSVFGVYFGTGIGSAWLQGGDPFRPRSACLQAGHIPVAAEGRPCKCGNVDCVEAYASGHTLRALAREHEVPLDALFAYRGNAALEQALERFVTWQGFLLATIATLLEPDMIVIGGGIPGMRGYPRERLLDVVRRQLQKPHPSESQRLGFAELAEHAPLHGASMLLELASRADRQLAPPSAPPSASTEPPS